MAGDKEIKDGKDSKGSKPKEKDILKEIKKELLDNMTELTAAFMILVIVLFLFALKRGYFTGIIGSSLIIVMALERRGSMFDKLTSMFVVFFLALCFFFL